MSSAPTSNAERPAGGPLVELAIGAAWMVGTAAGIEVVGAFLGRGTFGTAIVTAVLVSFVVEHVGLRSLEPVVRRVGHAATGAAYAALVFAVVLGAVALAGGVRSVRPMAGLPVSLGLAIVRLSAVAVRNELLLRGLPFAVARRVRIPNQFAQAFGALAGGASVVLAPGANLGTVALATASGWFFAGLWRSASGVSWTAVGANVAWTLIAGPLLEGGLIDVEWYAVPSRLPGVAGLTPWLGALVFVGAAKVAAGVGRATRARAQQVSDNRRQSDSGPLGSGES